MRNLYLNKLKDGFPGITTTVGAFLAEAAAYCLHSQGFQNGAIMEIVGDYEESFHLYWDEIINEQVFRAWNDNKEAVEYGATAIAILLLSELTEFVIGGRSYQSSRTDYWLINKESDTLESPQAMLEVSGIFQELPNNTVSIRWNKKKKNIEKISRREESVFIVTVSFNPPKAKIGMI